jgi:hypothetical protein
MTKEEAIKVFNNLILQVMAVGGFKDFNALDQCREALKTLEAETKKE